MNRLLSVTGSLLSAVDELLLLDPPQAARYRARPEAALTSMKSLRVRLRLPPAPVAPCSSWPFACRSSFMALLFADSYPGCDSPAPADRTAPASGSLFV